MNTNIKFFLNMRIIRKYVRVVLFILLLFASIVGYNIINAIFNGLHNGDERKNGIHLRKDALIPCERFDVSKEICKKSGCSWIPLSLSNKTSCFYKEDTGYQITGDIQTDGIRYKVRLKRKGFPTVFGMNVHQYMTVKVDMFSSNTLRIYFYPEKPAFEIPEEAIPMNDAEKKNYVTFMGEDKIEYQHTTSLINHQYSVIFKKTPYFGIQVIRKSTGAVIFNTTLPGLTFSNQFLQISTKLPSENVYGFGQHSHEHFRHDMNWRRWSIFARAAKPIAQWNYYGAHPVYMNLENDGNANMVFLKNSNAMDIFLQPNPYPAITYRTIGGVLDFYIFLGPTPEEALQQYTEVIGRPMMPTYWALGFHLCRWGYKKLSHVEAVVERTKRAKIPQDGQWIDIDYMDRYFIFTYTKDSFRGLPSFVDKLHRDGQKFVVILNPGLGSDLSKYNGVKAGRPGYQIYEDGKYNDVFIKTATGDHLKGEVWPGIVAFVDFTYLNRTLPWWQRYIKYLYSTEDIKFDGLWIDKNEPDNKYKSIVENCTNNEWNNPPYVPNILNGGDNGGSINAKTICMDSKQHWGKHYDVHNLYGHSMSIATNKALQNIFPSKRPFVLTRSSFSGTGKYAATWLGDNESEWNQMFKSIIGILEHGLFGFSMVGADICGFDFNADYEMCLRWSQLGAFYPFARNHNHRRYKDQDPAAWDDQFINIVREALLTRYRILPYMYTLFHDAHVYGKTVARPLMFEFPTDASTWDIFRQYLLGPAFMISPVMDMGKRSVDAYFPKGRWYSLVDGTEIKNTGIFQTLKAPLDVINLHLRGGYILPVQEPDNTTVYSRRRPMGLLVSFNDNYSANGHLFWDDGESKDTFKNGNYLFLTFHAAKGQYLDIGVKHNSYPEADNLVFANIEFYGMNGLPRDVYVNGHQLDAKHLEQKDKVKKPYHHECIYDEIIKEDFNPNVFLVGQICNYIPFFKTPKL